MIAACARNHWASTGRQASSSYLQVVEELDGLMATLSSLALSGPAPASSDPQAPPALNLPSLPLEIIELIGARLALPRDR